MPKPHKRPSKPEDPGDIDSLDLPEWRKQRLRELQRRAAGGKKRLFGEGASLVPPGTACPLRLAEGNFKPAHGELVGDRGPTAVGGVRSFPAAVVILRKRLGLTRAELARRAGLTEEGLRLLEQGERRPYLDTAVALAKALHVAVAVLAGEAPVTN